MQSVNDKEYIIKAVRFMDRIERTDGNVVVLSNDFVNELTERLTTIADNLKAGE